MRNIFIVLCACIVVMLSFDDAYASDTHDVYDYQACIFLLDFANQHERADKYYADNLDAFKDEHPYVVSMAVTTMYDAVTYDIQEIMYDQKVGWVKAANILLETKYSCNTY